MSRACTSLRSSPLPPSRSVPCGSPQHRSEPGERPGARSTAADLPVLADSVPSSTPAQGWLNSAPLSQADFAARSSSTTSGRTRASTACGRSPTCARGTTATRPTASSSSGSTRRSSTSRRTTTTCAARCSSSASTGRSPSTTTWRSGTSSRTSTGPRSTSWTARAKLRFVHFGEGDYSTNEDVIRVLLGVPADSPRGRGQPCSDAAADQTQGPTSARSGALAQQFGSLQPPERKAPARSPSPTLRPTSGSRSRANGSCRVSTCKRPTTKASSCCATTPVRSISSRQGPGTGATRASAPVVVELDGAPVREASASPA